jgi:hypothetical protein
MELQSVNKSIDTNRTNINMMVINTNMIKDKILIILS